MTGASFSVRQFLLPEARLRIGMPAHPAQLAPFVAASGYPLTTRGRPAESTRAAAVTPFSPWKPRRFSSYEDPRGGNGCKWASCTSWKVPLYDRCGRARRHVVADDDAWLEPLARVIGCRAIFFSDLKARVVVNVELPACFARARKECFCDVGATAYGNAHMYACLNPLSELTSFIARLKNGRQTSTEPVVNADESYDYAHIH